MSDSSPPLRRLLLKQEFLRRRLQRIALAHMPGFYTLCYQTTQLLGEVIATPYWQ